MIQIIWKNKLTQITRRDILVFAKEFELFFLCTRGAY